MARSPLVLLDACAVVNLYASRKMPDILAVVEGTLAIVDTVEREVQFVLRGGSAENAREREPIDLRPLIATGTLSVIATDDEDELLTFIDLTRDLDEGEAMTAAIAIHRAAAVVTDDRKAARVLGGHDVVCRSTLDLLKAWAETHALADIFIRSVLVDLRERGSYEPPKSHPLRGWWDGIISST